MKIPYLKRLGELRYNPENREYGHVLLISVWKMENIALVATIKLQVGWDKEKSPQIMVTGTMVQLSIIFGEIPLIVPVSKSKSYSGIFLWN